LDNSAYRTLLLYNHTHDSFKDGDIPNTPSFFFLFILDLSFRNIEVIQVKNYLKILSLTLFGFTGTVAIANESIPIEVTAAAEAQQAALEYEEEKDQKPESSDE
jgi:hypothetical protein